MLKKLTVCLLITLLLGLVITSTSNIALAKSAKTAKIRAKGTVQKRAQFDAFMSGSHYLIIKGKITYLLSSRKINLNKYNEKTVTIKGKVLFTIEGKQRIEVTSVGSRQ